MKKTTVSFSDDMHYKFMMCTQMRGSKMTEIMRRAALKFVYETEKKIGPIVRHAALTSDE